MTRSKWAKTSHILKKKKKSQPSLTLNLKKLERWLRLSMNVSPPLKNLGPPPPPPCLSTCHKPQYCLGTRPSTGGETCLATLKLAGATSMFRVSHSSMGRPRRAGERASKVMFAKNQSVLMFIDILPSKVSLGYGAK